jgi:hypothetical protein
VGWRVWLVQDFAPNLLDRGNQIVLHSAGGLLAGTEHHTHLLFFFIPEGGHEVGPLLIEHPELRGVAGLGTHPSADRSCDADLEEIKHIHEAQSFGDVRCLAQTGFEAAQAVR